MASLILVNTLVSTIASDKEASHILYHKWYMVNGNAVVIAIIKKQGPNLCLLIMISFSLEIKWLNLVLLGAPIRDLSKIHALRSMFCFQGSSRLVPKTLRLLFYCYASVAAFANCTPGQIKYC